MLRDERRDRDDRETPRHDKLRAQGYTGWSIRTVLTPLSRLLNHAVRRGAIRVKPVGRLADGAAGGVGIGAEDLAAGGRSGCC